ncbi:transposase [Escherichia coli TA007]|nr:transposase [Escherichia coli TA007]
MNIQQSKWLIVTVCDGKLNWLLSGSKVLLHLDALRAKEPELAKAWIFANLLAAFLIDDIIQPSLDFPPRSAGSEKKN